MASPVRWARPGLDFCATAGYNRSMDDFEQRLRTCTREELTAAWPFLVADVLTQLRSREPSVRFARILRDRPEIGRIFEAWDELDEPSRGLAWDRLGRLLTEAAYATRPYCVRCGECCRRAGPALLQEDLGLIETGVLEPSHLLTLRPGEPGWSPFEDRVVLLDHEVVRIKSRPGQGCLWYDPDLGCRIYADRPQQCRQLECWNPEAHIASASDRHLGRRDLPLTEAERRFLDLQEQQAPLAALAAAVEAHRQGDPAGADRAVRLLEADLALRRDAQQAGLDPARFDFLLGRPLVMVLPALGLVLARDDNGEWALGESSTEEMI